MCHIKYYQVQKAWGSTTTEVSQKSSLVHGLKAYQNEKNKWKTDKKKASLA